MKTLNDHKKRLMENPAFKREYDIIKMREELQETTKILINNMAIAFGLDDKKHLT